MKSITRVVLLAGFLAQAGTSQERRSPEPRTKFESNVEMVAVTFSVTDSKGHAVTGLTQADVRIFEDGIPESIASFAQGSKVLSEEASGQDHVGMGTSIFVLFNTSNRMYLSFPYVYDAIAEFLRRLDPADSVAIYTFSRNLCRIAPLTNDHAMARNGMTNTAAGDDSALFNALLLTLRDAAPVPGRKAIVVFSNGPDNASMVSPYDVGRVAQDEGIPIYIISAPDSDERHVLTNALHSLVQRTGGKLYWVETWQKHSEAFESVRQDMATSYTAWYYPAPNENNGFREIRVQITAPDAKAWHVRARGGYSKAHLGTRMLAPVQPK